jgi:hypothetical protein
MIGFYKASKHSNGVSETSVCQRLTQNSFFQSPCFARKTIEEYWKTMVFYFGCFLGIMWTSILLVTCLEYSTMFRWSCGALWFLALLHYFDVLVCEFRNSRHLTALSSYEAAAAKVRAEFHYNTAFRYTKTDDYRAYLRSRPSASARHRARIVNFRCWLSDITPDYKNPHHTQEFRTQGGFCPSRISRAFQDLASVRGLPMDAELMNKVENLGALFLALKDSTTVSQFLAIVFLYLKTHYSVSVANKCAGYIAEAVDTTFDPQTGEFGDTIERPKWLELLKNCQENWTLVITNPGFKKLSRVLSLCLALGLCDSASLDFEVKGMRLFSITAYSKQVTAVDMIDAAFETVAYFAEGGYMCFARGSIKPLLHGNLESEEFEEAYAKCMRCDIYAKSGNLLARENMQENDYAALLAQTIDKCRILSQQSLGLVDKNILTRKLHQLQTWEASFFQTRVQGGMREAPYSIGVFGGTAVGKSSVANILMVTTLLQNGFCADDDRIVNVNENDKYMSNYRTHVNGVLIDDLGNTKAKYVEKAPTQLLIQLVNNVRTYANMASLDQKGSVSIEPKLVISTKNVKDSCANLYSNEPASVTRRDNITITVTVKPEFATHDMIDSKKIHRQCPWLFEGSIWRCPDLWNIKVERSFPVPPKDEKGTATVGWEVVDDDDGYPMDCIGLPDLIQYLKGATAAHYSDQEKLVETNNNVASKVLMCPTCELPWPDNCSCTFRETPFSIQKDGKVLDSRDGTIKGVLNTVENGDYSDEYVRHSQADYYTQRPGDSSDEESSDEDSYDGAHFEADDYSCSDEDSSHGSDDESPDDPFEPQLGERIAASLWVRYRRLQPLAWAAFNFWTTKAEVDSLDWAIERLDWLETSRWAQWTNWIPSEWFS